MGVRSLPFVVNSTGQVIGGKAAQPCEVTVYGWVFNNSSTAGTVSFYVPTAVNVGNGQVPAVPSAAGTLLFTIPAGATPVGVVQSFPDGIYFKDGLFVITSAVGVTGVVFYS